MDLPRPLEGENEFDPSGWLSFASFNRLLQAAA